MAANSAAQQRQDDTLHMTRRFKAPREKVFRAFTDIETFRKWFGPPGCSVIKAEMNVHPGGRYRLTIRSPEGTLRNLEGVYREVRPHERLVLTWTLADGDFAGRETLLTLEFRDADGGTELALSHAMMPDAEMRNRANHGWNGSFDRLDALLAG
jgi:uncharacterized protein YndB with AHSA1/START domain